MPLGVREVLLVVRAQNLSSGVLRNVAGDFNNLNGAAKTAAQQQMKTGTALMAVGAGITAVGAAGIAFLAKATSAAVDYNKQVALTKTQMYGVKASLQDVSEAGLQVAKDIAVPLSQVQAGLYDIFSSMDVNMTQAKFLLANFSKEAVAGNVDLSTAERATIGVMNSYKMKVQDVTKVQDIMFNLVKYGVGTYGDFANSIGRVTPSAVRANQTFETTAGMMAFLTRNGLSAANASSSAARALDAIGKSRTSIEKIGVTVQGALGDETAKKLGFTAGTMIKVTDASGKLLPVNKIMTEMGTALKGLNPSQLNDVLTAMFKGTGGTIQAMRFFDVAIKNFGQLNSLTNKMYTSRGALQAAYKIMSNTPAAKIQLLKNNFQALMITIGNQLLPVLGKLAGALAGMFGWIDKIPKPVLAALTIFIAVTSVLMVLAGIILIVVGAWMVLSAILAASEVAIGSIALTFGLIILAIGALAVAAYLIVKYWGPISTFWHNLWFDIWHWVDEMWSNVVNFLHESWSTFINDWTKFGHGIESVWNDTWEAVFNYVHGAWSSFINDLVGFGHNLEHIWSDIWPILLDVLKDALTAIMVLWVIWWDYFGGPIKAFVNWVRPYLKALWAALTADWRAFSHDLEAAWDAAWGFIKSVLQVAWGTITKDIRTAISTITGVWKAFTKLLQAIWSLAWTAIALYFSQQMSALKKAFKGATSALSSDWKAFSGTLESEHRSLWSYIVGGWTSQFWNPIKKAFSVGKNALTALWNDIKAPLAKPVNWVISSLYDNGIRKLWNDAAKLVGGNSLPNVGPIKLAQGGVVNKPTLGIFGEDGPEAILPLSKPSRMKSILGSLGLPMFGGGGLFGDIGSVAKSIGGWVSSGAGKLGSLVFKPIQAMVNAVPGSGMMRTMMVDTGKKLVSEAVSALTGKGNTNAKGISKMVGNVGSGVARWKSTVLQALSMEGLPASLAQNVLYQMMTESGGNPNAINLTDSNAAAGDPSRGLLQTIMSTFQAFHWPGTSNNIYNPLANIAAAINYARHTYGPNLANSFGGMGSGHGYASGSWSVPRTEHALVHKGEMIVPAQQAQQIRSGGGPPQQVINITTNEIDPRRHAAELGWELARRSA
jgi:TP901 family phage tail tape measure protein